MSTNTKPLSPKQLRFCREYVIDYNGTQAAIRSGYSKKTANEQSAQLLAKLSIQEEVSRLKSLQYKRLQMSADEVLAELSLIARADLAQAFEPDGNLKPIHSMPDSIRRALSGIDTEELFDGQGEEREMVGFTKKIKLFDKIRALGYLGEHFGMFKGENAGGVQIFTQMGAVKVGGKELKIEIG